jgi:hypothetical protein
VNELGRRARVQSEFVLDLDVARNQPCTPAPAVVRNSDATRIAFDPFSLMRCASVETPQHFVITADGIALAPGEYCTGCTDSFPTIPLADLSPTHPWAVKWLAWVRERVDQNETLVKYVR